MGSCKLLNRHFITPMKLQCDMNSSEPIFKTTIVLKEKWIYFLNVLKVIIFVKFTNLQWYTTTYTSVIVWQVLHPQEVVFVTRHGFFFFVIRSYLTMALSHIWIVEWTKTLCFVVLINIMYSIVGNRRLNLCLGLKSPSYPCCDNVTTR